jgi:hypothetical protein
MITATVASTAMKAGEAGRGIRFKKRQARLEQQLNIRELQEHIRLAEYNEGLRTRKLASKIATQMAVVNGAGILGGKTTDYLRDSLEMQAAVERARQADSAAETVNQLLVGVQQSRLEQQETTLAGGFSLADTIAGGSSDFAGEVGEIVDNRATVGKKP